MRRATRKVCWGLLLAVGLLAPALAAPEVEAQGRYEDKTEAEQRYIDGQRLEDEAVSLKKGSPDEAEEKFDEAIEAYTEALKLEPGMIDAYVRLGYVYYALEKVKEAEAVLKPAVRRWPNNVALKRVYGTILFGLEARRKEAVANLEAVAKDNEFYDVLFLLGKHYYEAGDNARAATLFRRYLKQRPQDVRIHGTLGNIYFKTGKYEPALAEFRYVLSLQPTNMPARINIANINFKKGKFDKAIGLYAKILKEQPKQSGVRFNLASSLFQTRQYDKALAQYGVFSKLLPRQPAGHYWQSLCLIELGRAGEARAMLARTLELSPKHAKANWRLGLLDAKEGKLAEARAHLETANKLDPKDPWILLGLGDVLRRQGEVNAAIASHIEAVKLDGGKQPRFFAALGRDYFAAGDWSKAVQALARAHNIDKKDDPIKRAYAVALLRRGHEHLKASRLEEAGGDAAACYALGTRPLEARLLLGAVALARDDLDKAAGHIEAASRIDDKHPHVRHALGRLAIARKDGEKAVAALELLLDKNKTRSQGVANDLARAYALTDQWGRALEWFVNARTLGMNEEAANRNIALASLNFGEQQGTKGKWKQAVAAFETTAKFAALLTPLQRLRLDLDLGIAYTETSAFPKALRRLNTVARALRKMPADERASLPSKQELALELRLAYVQYRIGKLDEAIRVLERTPRVGRHARDVQTLLVSAYTRRAAQLYKGGKKGRASAAELLKKAAKINKADEVVKHNLAVLEYSSGKGKRVGGVFKSLASSGKLPAALFNYAIYLDDIKKDERGAFDAYGKYLKRKGAASDEAKRYRDAKQRVFGFGLEGGGG